MDGLFIVVLVVLVLLVVFYMMSQRPTPPKVSPKIEAESPAPAPLVPNSSEEMLKTFYLPARDKVDLDFPPKKIGCCPFSRPVSSDLPIQNIPMCYASVAQTHLKPI